MAFFEGVKCVFFCMFLSLNPLRLTCALVISRFGAHQKSTPLYDAYAVLKREQRISISTDRRGLAVFTCFFKHWIKNHIVLASSTPNLHCYTARPGSCSVCNRTVIRRLVEQLEIRDLLRGTSMAVKRQSSECCLLFSAPRFLSLVCGIKTTTRNHRCSRLCAERKQARFLYRWFLSIWDFQSSAFSYKAVHRENSSAPYVSNLMRAARSNSNVIFLHAKFTSSFHI